MLRPYSLINSHGKAHFGRFEQPVNEVNIENADFRTPMNKPASKWKKYFSTKRFQYFGGIADDLIFGCALADIRYIGAVFVYVYRPSDKRMRTWQFKTPLAWGLNLSNRPDNGVSSFNWGKNHIAMRYTLNSAGERRKQLEIKFGKTLQLTAESFEPSTYESMALCTPCGFNGWIYAQKTAGNSVKGELSCELGSWDLEQSQCYGHHDFSAGFMRRETFWNWACFSGFNGKDRIGLNVSWGVNETGYSENCFWLNDRLIPLPQVQFRFDRDNDHSSWRVSSEDGRIDLAFVPEGMHRERMNALILATNFRQIFGRFKGHLIDENGQRHEVENMYGFVEDQYSKW